MPSVQERSHHTYLGVKAGPEEIGRNHRSELPEMRCPEGEVIESSSGTMVGDSDGMQINETFQGNSVAFSSRRCLPIQI